MKGNMGSPELSVTCWTSDMPVRVKQYGPKQAYKNSHGTRGKHTVLGEHREGDLFQVWWLRAE